VKDRLHAHIQDVDGASVWHAICNDTCEHILPQVRLRMILMMIGPPNSRVVVVPVAVVPSAVKTRLVEAAPHAMTGQIIGIWVREDIRHLGFMFCFTFSHTLLHHPNCIWLPCGIGRYYFQLLTLFHHSHTRHHMYRFSRSFSSS